MGQALAQLMSIETEAGRLSIARAGSDDYDIVMAILREAADWLIQRGNPQWQHWYMDFGEQLLRERLEHHEVYLFRAEKIPIGTVTIQWTDAEVWGGRGSDGLAGYIHGIGIVRSMSGRQVGERILEWAVEQIRQRERQFARLDAQASNKPLCRYYEKCGFHPLETTLLAGNFTTRLFQRKLR
ncbi:MAG TPA: GNAT family N-acetyltransferase [Candidatus Binataceae bacterium]|nr:GNAT family N-acetyltransferase [Candidatus Binataceae bacterium]